jgi:hypothetical protein
MLLVTLSRGLGKDLLFGRLTAPRLNRLEEPARRMSNFLKFSGMQIRLVDVFIILYRGKRTFVLVQALRRLDDSPCPRAWLHFRQRRHYLLNQLFTRIYVN